MSTLEETIDRPQFTARQISRAVKFVGGIAFSAVLAYGASQHSAASREARIGVLEEKVRVLDTNLVPRIEHEAHWRAMEEAQRGLQADMREVRDTQKQILLKLSK